jgi:hypothetical protein
MATKAIFFECAFRVLTILKPLAIQWTASGGLNRIKDTCPEMHRRDYQRAWSLLPRADWLHVGMGPTVHAAW